MRFSNKDTPSLTLHTNVAQSFEDTESVFSNRTFLNWLIDRARHHTFEVHPFFIKRWLGLPDEGLDGGQIFS